MSQPHIFVGGTRDLTPASGYSTASMTLVKPGQGLPPYEVERYVRTDLRIEIPGEVTGPAVVYVLDSLSFDRAELTRTLTEWAAGSRVAEHFRFMRTGEGRPWSRSA